MSTFVDTSAFYAILDRDDDNHEAAARIWADLVSSGEDLLTTNYVVVETDALVRRRMGVHVSRRFHEDLLPVGRIEWIEAAVHSVAVGAALASGRRGPSLVDCSSFEVIRAAVVERVFAFDDHFRERGYTIAR